MSTEIKIELGWLRRISAQCFRQAVKADKRENVPMADALFGASTKLDKARHYLKEEVKATNQNSPRGNQRRKRK